MGKAGEKIIEGLEHALAWAKGDVSAVHAVYDAAEIARLRAALATARNDALEEAAEIAEKRADDYQVASRNIRASSAYFKTISVSTAVTDKAGCCQSIADTIRALKEKPE